MSSVVLTNHGESQYLQQLSLKFVHTGCFHLNVATFKADNFLFFTFMTFNRPQNIHLKPFVSHKCEKKMIIALKVITFEQKHPVF